MRRNIRLKFAHKGYIEFDTEKGYIEKYPILVCARNPKTHREECQIIGLLVSDENLIGVEPFQAISIEKDGLKIPDFITESQAKKLGLKKAEKGG